MNVPECSWMFLNVPECSQMFQVNVHLNVSSECSFECSKQMWHTNRRAVDILLKLNVTREPTLNVPNVQCSECSYFSTKAHRGSFLRHVKSVHEGVKFPCQQCEYKAATRGSLLKHVKSVHEGVKFPCKQYEYKATQKGHLLTHIKSIHEGAKFPWL